MGWKLVGGIAFASVTLDNPDLRQRVIAEIEAYRVRARSASEWLREQVRQGKAGLNNPPREQ